MSYDIKQNTMFGGYNYNKTKLFVDDESLSWWWQGAVWRECSKVTGGSSRMWEAERGGRAVMEKRGSRVVWGCC